MTGHDVVTFATGNRDALPHLVAAIRDLDDPEWKGNPDWILRRGVIARRRMPGQSGSRRVHLHHHVDDCHGLDLLRATWRMGDVITGSLTIPHVGSTETDDVLGLLRRILAPASAIASERALERGLRTDASDGGGKRLVHHSRLAAIVATAEGLVPKARDVVFPSPWAETLLSDGAERPAGTPSEEGRGILADDFADMPRFATILSRSPRGDRLFDVSITPSHRAMPKIDPVEAMRRLAALQ